MQSEPARCGAFPDSSKLGLHPSQGLHEQSRRLLRQGPPVLVQLGAERSHGTAKPGQLLAPVHLDLHEAAQPLLGRSRLVQFCQQLSESRDAQVDDRVADLLLGLEVVVDIAQRDSGFLRDVGQRGIAEATPVGDLQSGLSEANSIIRFHSCHRDSMSRLTDPNDRCSVASQSTDLSEGLPLTRAPDSAISRARYRSWRSVLLAALAIGLISPPRVSSSLFKRDAPHWVGTWATAPQPGLPGRIQTYRNQTLRLIVHVSVGGKK